MKATRTDIHRPQVFDPSKYEIVAWIDAEPPRWNPPMLDGRLGAETILAEAYAQYRQYLAWHLSEIKKWLGEWTKTHELRRCGHCGHPGIRYISVARHKETGEQLPIGEECANNRLHLTSRAEFSAKYIRSKAANDAKHLLRLQKRLEAYAKWAPANLEAATWLSSLDDRTAHPFLQDMIRNVREWGNLSEKQTAAVLKFKQGAERIAAQRAAQIQPTELAPQGRVTVVGTIIKRKAGIQPKYGEEAFPQPPKLIVKLEDGNLIYVTETEAFRDSRYEQDEFGRHVSYRDVVGLKVKVSATFERSDRDEHFAFGKRPVIQEVK